MISASDLYNYLECPTRAYADHFWDQAGRDDVSPFVKMLWECGNVYETKIIEGLDRPFVNLRDLPIQEKVAATIRAMAERVPLIYGGRIEANGKVGEPDLLELAADGYKPGDIKSGNGLEDMEEGDGRLKRSYGIQLAHYVAILRDMGALSQELPYIWDGRGEVVAYDLDQKLGPKSPSIAELYIATLGAFSEQTEGQIEPPPALSSKCKLCHWRSTCGEKISEASDLSLVPMLGRTLRDTLLSELRTLDDLANANLDDFISGKKTAFKGVGPDRLRLFQERARLLLDKNARPYLKQPIALPALEREIFFDIEVDPMRDIVYLHGFVERSQGGQTFHAFFADQADPASEEAVFQAAVAYLRASAPAAVYYYSKYERTQYRRLAAKYPGVISLEEVNALFENAAWVDLLDVVRSGTEWPTNDHSIKTLAKYLGFKWRDTDPSGAASIEWYDRYVTTGDAEIRRRILEYNEDDCVATAVLLDGLRAMAE